MRRISSSVAIAAAVAMAHSPVFGQETASPQATAPDGPQGLVSAVQTAETELEGRAIEAETDSRDGRLVYEVEVVSGDEIHEAIIDAGTGAVLSTDRQTVSGTWRGWFDTEELEAIRTAPRSLGEILPSVEEELGGVAREAGLDEADDRFFYEIELVRAAGDVADAFRAEVYVDVATGDIMYDEPDD